jgi:sugar phosphate isomerase/epimerase
MLKAGVSTACLYPQPVEEALYDLVLGGVTTVELFINTHSELKRRFVANMAEILQRFDASCCSLHPYTCELEPMMLFSPYERRTADYLEYCRYYFTAMQQLGAKIFVLHGNKQIAAVNQDFYFERFGKLVALGKSYDVIVAQENVARCTSRSLAFLQQMKQEMGNDAKFVLDIKQAVRAQEDPFEMLRTLGSHVVHVHISDHGEYGDCLQIGSGRFAVKSFLQTLAAVSPDCTVMLELYRSGFQTLQDLLHNYHILQHMIQSCNE